MNIHMLIMKQYVARTESAADSIIEGLPDSYRPLPKIQRDTPLQGSHHHERHKSPLRDVMFP